MSLNWDATKIANYEELQTDEEWAKTNSLIWVSIVLQYGWELTEKNVDEAWNRLFAFNSIARHKDDLTYADLKRRIGLKTNSGEMTNAQWRKHLDSIITRKANEAK